MIRGILLEKRGVLSHPCTKKKKKQQGGVKSNIRKKVTKKVLILVVFPVERKEQKEGSPGHQKQRARGLEGREDLGSE